MTTSKVLHDYKLISKNEEICEEILKSLSDLDPILCEENEHIDANDEFYAAEIKKLELPPDFVEAVYILSEKEFWDCYRYNTFKPFQRISILKKHPKIKDRFLPRLLRIHKGINYKNYIYKNRDHLLYLDRIELLQNLQFVNTDEAKQIIQKHQDVLKVLEEEDQERKRLEEIQEKEEMMLKEEKEEERIAQKMYKLSGGLKY